MKIIASFSTPVGSVDVYRNPSTPIGVRWEVHAPGEPPIQYGTRRAALWSARHDAIRLIRKHRQPPKFDLVAAWDRVRSYE